MRIGIIGAGTWGMALARMLSNSGHGVQVWSPHPETVERLAATRTQKNLPDMIIPEAVRFTKEMGEVCSNKDMLVFAVPSVYVRSAARQASPFIREGQIIVDMPIIRAVDAIVNHNADPRTVVARLMGRDKTAERKG